MAAGGLDATGRRGGPAAASFQENRETGYSQEERGSEQPDGCRWAGQGGERTAWRGHGGQVSRGQEARLRDARSRRAAIAGQAGVLPGRAPHSAQPEGPAVPLITRDAV